MSAQSGARAGTITCPRCGRPNPEDAVFCRTPGCGKALGDFLYAAEEIEKESKVHEKIADRVAAFIGNPYFIVIHAVWFLLWVAINTGLVTMSARFDDYPFGLLGIILSIEAIFITGFLLISQNRQAAFADKRSELDYDVNVRTFREIQDVKLLLASMQERIERIEESLRDR